jgi:glycosyltransferase involved in cell wall biosynthesis
VAIHQVLVSAAFGDAITDEAIGMSRLLGQRSESRVFARHRDPVVKSVRPLDELAASASTPEDVLILHTSIGDSDVFDLLRGRRERLVLRYHNITPSRFFRAFDPELAAKLELGRRQVAELKDRVVLALADSTFNADDLTRLGYERIVVLPLLVDLNRLKSTRPRQPRVAIPATGREPVILFVGRLAPNKAQHLLIQAFHILATYLRPDAQLILAGGGDEAYVAALSRFIRELALPGVTLTGKLDTAELVALYRRADVFLCLSAHEGFCVPLLEAMAFDVPIVASTATAVGETLGGAGIRLEEPRPALAAEAVRTVLGNSDLRRRLVERGRRRLRDFAPQKIGSRLMASLAEVG